MPSREPDPAAPPRARQILAAVATGVLAALLVLDWTASDQPAHQVAEPAARGAPAALPPRPEPEPIAPLPRELSEALELVARGRLRDAQRLMISFRAGPGAETLDPEHRETLTAMLERLANDPVLDAAIALERGFVGADLPALRRTLASLGREEMITLRRDPEAARNVDQARRLTAEVDAIEARLSSDRLAALRLAQDFRYRHPRFAVGLGFEQRAARAIEDTAGRLIAANRLDEARAVLVELRSLRGEQAADQPGIQAKLATIDSAMKRRRDFDTALREIETLGWELPHEALDQLARMERTPETAGRLAQLESTLEMLMDDRDRETPEIAVLTADGSPLERLVYQPRQDVSLLVRARDDYQLAFVRFHWRWFSRDGAGEVMTIELHPPASEPLETNGPTPISAALEFPVTIRADEHQDRGLQVWAEASDRGGRNARSTDAATELLPERRGLLRRLGLRRDR